MPKLRQYMGNRTTAKSVNKKAPALPTPEPDTQKSVSEKQIYYITLFLCCQSIYKKGCIFMSNLKKRKDGRYCRQIRINGKVVSFYGKTEREINRKMLEYRESEKKGKPFDAVAAEWQREHFENIEHNTIRQYKPALEQIIDRFSGISIKDIQSNDVSNFIKSVAAKKYAQKTVRTRLLVLNLIFKYAIINNYVDINPCQYISIPKNLPKTKREAPTLEEIEVVKNSIDNTFGFYAYFVLYTGMRRGEALAVKYSDVDFVNKTVSVNKSVYFVGNFPHIKQPKTEAGIRRIIIPDCLFSELNKRKTAGLIFSNENGDIIKNGEFTRLWRKYQAETGLEITSHQLRHAYATILFEAGIDVKDAQEMLGHSTIQVTRDIYTHISKSRTLKTADKLNSFLSQDKA